MQPAASREPSRYIRWGEGLAPAGRHTMLDPAVSKLQEGDVQSRYGDHARAPVC
jgi:hypothetical protein